MTPLQQAAQDLITRWDSPAWKDQPHTAHYVAELRKALDAELQQSVEPVAFKQFLSDVITAAGLVTHGKQCKALGERISDGAFQYMLHPPQQATVKQYLKVGDSRFESWYSELNQAGKGSKQILREAYEAGLNEDDAQQVKQVPMTDDQIEAACRFIEPSFDGPIAYDLQIARAIEAHHGIGGQP